MYTVAMATEQDGRRAAVIGILEQALQEGASVNFAEIARATGYVDSGPVWKIYHSLQDQGLPLPPIEKTTRATVRRQRIAQARREEDPTDFKTLADELGITESSARTIASREGVTRTDILTPEEATAFRGHVLLLWNQGLRLSQMVPQLQAMGYKATPSQLTAAFNDLKESGAITENARDRQKRLREEQFIQEILSEKSAQQICEDMDITPRVFEILERRLREKIQEKVATEEDLQKIEAKKEHIRALKRAQQQNQPPEVQNQPDIMQEEQADDNMQEDPIETQAAKELLASRKEQIKAHLIALRQHGGIVIPHGPILIEGTQTMQRFAQLNRSIYNNIQILRMTMPRTPLQALKFSLPTYHTTPEKSVFNEAQYTAIVNKGYQYQADIPDPSGINDFLRQHLHLFAARLLSQTGVAYSQDDITHVLDAFFTTS